jgi:hypothetical protein
MNMWIMGGSTGCLKIVNLGGIIDNSLSLPDPITLSSLKLRLHRFYSQMSPQNVLGQTARGQGILNVTNDILLCQQDFMAMQDF